MSCRLVEDAGVGLLDTELSVVLVLIAVSDVPLSSDWLHAIAHTQVKITNRDLVVQNIFNN